MSEISDEFKVVVVGAIAALCQKYPRKHAVMMNYLSSMLRDEVGFGDTYFHFYRKHNMLLCKDMPRITLLSVLWISDYQLHRHCALLLPAAQLSERVSCNLVIAQQRRNHPGSDFTMPNQLFDMLGLVASAGFVMLFVRILLLYCFC